MSRKIIGQDPITGDLLLEPKVAGNAGCEHCGTLDRKEGSTLCSECLSDDLLNALADVARLCTAPCMSREVQAHFERNTGADAYRMELNGVLLAMREKAKAAIARNGGAS